MTEQTEHQPRDDQQALEVARSLGHEVRDTNIKGVMLFAIGLMVLLATAMAIIYGVMIWTERADQRDPRDIAITGAWMLDEDVAANQEFVRRQKEAAERQLLETYGWVDREQRIARIPVRRAMEVLGARGTLAIDFAEEQTRETDTSSESR